MSAALTVALEDPMGTWKIDPAHTDVSFSAKHMMTTAVRAEIASAGVAAA